MPSRLRLCPTVLFAVTTAALAGSAEAQDWRWPEKGKNFQVFPKDFPAQKLSAQARNNVRVVPTEERLPVRALGQL